MCGFRTTPTAAIRLPAKFDEFHDNRDKVLPWLKQYSPIEHVTKDDPPIFMEYLRQKVPPVPGEKQADATHSAVMGLKLEEKLSRSASRSSWSPPGQPHLQYKNPPRT